jgi:hypothetical protein
MLGPMGGIGAQFSTLRMDLAHRAVRQTRGVMCLAYLVHLARSWWVHCWPSWVRCGLRVKRRF